MTANLTYLPVKRQLIDKIIIFILFLLLPVDMLNGIILKSGINLPISISQIFKLFIILILFIRLILFPKFEVLFLLFVFSLLCLPSLIHQIFGKEKVFFLLDDVIKTSKYVTPFLSLIFFKSIFQQNLNIQLRKLIDYWIYISYAIFAINILIKYVGLGFPMYEYANTGTKGFFYSGNEISALFLVLYVYLAFKLWEIKSFKFYYFLFFIFNMIIGITITSKTSMIGVILIAILIPIKFREFLFVSIKKIFTISLIILLVIPASLYLGYRLLSGSLIMERFQYFYAKLDPVTFIFSGRNLKAEKMFETYREEYTWVQKLIGGGQYFYENKFEYVIEIDILDIFFAYGIMGIFIFTFILSILIFSSIIKTLKPYYPYAKLSFIILLVLLFTSSIAGHVFNSGIAGIYIGFIIAIMYIKNDTIK